MLIILRLKVTIWCATPYTIESSIQRDELEKTLNHKQRKQLQKLMETTYGRKSWRTELINPTNMFQWLNVVLVV